MAGADGRCRCQALSERIVKFHQDLKLDKVGGDLLHSATHAVQCTHLKRGTTPQNGHLNANRNDHPRERNPEQQERPRPEARFGGVDPQRHGVGS